MANTSPVGLGETLHTPEWVETCKAGGSISKGQAVKLSSAPGADGIATVVATTAVTEVGYGVALKSGASGDYIPVLKQGYVTVTAAGAINAGGTISVAANGKVAAQSTNPFFGYAITAASADGDTLLVRVVV